MSDGLLLAIDVGTGSARAVLFTPDGSPVAMGQREYSHPELPGAPGPQVFATSENWHLICECTREALAGSGALPDSVRAVSATSMCESEAPAAMLQAVAAVVHDGLGPTAAHEIFRELSHRLPTGVR